MRELPTVAKAEDRGPAAPRRRPAPAIDSPGRPLEEPTRREMEAVFGHDFGAVRVHADEAAAGEAEAHFARAFAYGDHLVFGRQEYAPHSVEGRRLLVHELTHVVQQRSPSPPNIEVAEREAGRAAHTGRPTPSLGGDRNARTATAPRLHLQVDRRALQARLDVVRARLAQLRARYRQLSDEFAESSVGARQRQSLEEGRRRLRTQVRSERAARQLWGGTVAAAVIRRVATASRSGNTVTVSAAFQLSYPTLSATEAEQRARQDIPRIEATVRDVWQVRISSGEYAGTDFRLVPRVTLLPRGAAASANAFQIQVRAPDTGPSEGDPVTGIISLAPVHLQGARVVVVAHELAHLFGFTDTYLPGTVGGRPWWAVGRPDAAGRADLLGLIDPVKLQELRSQGAISPAEHARQSQPVRVWEGEATTVLQVLGVEPAPPPRPTFDSPDFDPTVELDHVRRQGEDRLRDIRQRQERIDNSMTSITLAEEIMRLEVEERDLVRRLQGTP